MTRSMRENARRFGIALNSLGKTSDQAYLRFYLADFDDKYAYVEQLFADTANPDSKWTKGRLAYAMQSDETAAIDAASFETIVVKWLTMSEFAALDRQREEHASLLVYKQEIEAAERKNKLPSVNSGI